MGAPRLPTPQYAGHSYIAIPLHPHALEHHTSIVLAVDTPYPHAHGHNLSIAFGLNAPCVHAQTPHYDTIHRTHLASTHLARTHTRRILHHLSIACGVNAPHAHSQTPQLHTISPAHLGSALLCHTIWIILRSHKFRNIRVAKLSSTQYSQHHPPALDIRLFLGDTSAR